MFRDYRLIDISRREIDAFIAKATKDRKPATANRHLEAVKRMFNLAEEWEIIEKNPARFVKKLRENNRRTRVLSLEEETRLFSTAKPPHDLILMMALDTGMRRGEIMSLKWPAVRLNDGIIVVRSEDTKSGESRIIPIPARLAERLAGEDYRTGPVIRWSGRAIKSPRTALDRIFVKSGIKDIHFHDLRHTYASRLGAGGVRVELMRDALGHSDIKMTNRYTHFAPERLDDIRSAIDKVTGR